MGGQEDRQTEKGGREGREGREERKEGRNSNKPPRCPLLHANRTQNSLGPCPKSTASTLRSSRNHAEDHPSLP